MEKIVEKHYKMSWLPLLGILFIGLKLTGYINWSWVWVLAPFWIGFAVIGFILLIAAIIAIAAK